MEPFFSVVLSSLFLGDVPSLAVVATLVPIVGGVALASCTEMSFNWVWRCRFTSSRPCVDSACFSAYSWNLKNRYQTLISNSTCATTTWRGFSPPWGPT